MPYNDELTAIEEFAESILHTFSGREPNAGEVISLKEDLIKLLTTKYNVSIGSIR